MPDIALMLSSSRILVVDANRVLDKCESKCIRNAGCATAFGKCESKCIRSAGCGTAGIRENAVYCFEAKDV